MFKFVCGIMTLGFGVIMLIWIAYNLLIARQKEFTVAFGGLFFMGAFFVVGLKWIREGWPEISENSRPKKRRKKIKRRPVEYDDE